MGGCVRIRDNSHRNASSGAFSLLHIFQKLSNEMAIPKCEPKSKQQQKKQENRYHNGTYKCKAVIISY